MVWGREGQGKAGQGRARRKCYNKITQCNHVAKEDNDIMS